jgi:fructose 1,6-bisphosphatase
MWRRLTTDHDPLEGGGDDKIHKLGWDTLLDCTALAKELKLYGTGQDLLSDAFAGNVKGMGPGLAEMEMEERTSEPVIIYMADKTSCGAWNMPLYNMFADPFNMRAHGPFEPHRLPLDEMEYTTMPEVMKKLRDRFVKL